MFSGQRNKGRGCHAAGSIATPAGLPGLFVRTLACHHNQIWQLQHLLIAHMAPETTNSLVEKLVLFNPVAVFQPSSVVPEDGVLLRFPLWSLAERDHRGSQEEHVHAVVDPFGESRQHRRLFLLARPLRDDGLQHPPGLTLWQILGGLQRLQHSRGP